MIFLYLLVLVPVSLVLAYLVKVPSLWVFVSAMLAIIPLAEWIRRATEQTARIAGPSIGSLLNVSFGNAAELILAVFVLIAGRQEVVKAQITGSMVGNSLLGLGLAVLIGAWGRGEQKFDRERAGRLSSLLILAVFAILIPALFDYTERGLLAAPNAGALDEQLSLGVSILLIGVYIANLIYSLRQRRDTFAMDEGEKEPDNPEEQKKRWPLWVALAVLLGATAVIALEAELVSSSLEDSAKQLGLSTLFLGIVVLAVIGNFSELLSAIYFARKDRMSVVMGVTVGSTIQVALLMTPLLVIFSFLIGAPMNLVFAKPLELVAIASVAFVVDAIAHDGQTSWFEGLMLIAVYALIAVAFFLVSG